MQTEWATQMNHTLECYIVTAKEEDKDLWKTKILQTEGHRDIQGPQIENLDITTLVKTREVNIGTKAEPKFVKIKVYWDNATVDKVVELLHKYQDLFTTKFTDLKGIIEDLGVIKIMLKPNMKPVKQRPYCLNPKYKKKVHLEIDKMLAIGIIEPMEESNWVSPMVVQEKKKKDEIRICVDLRKLNDTCVHDPFPTPFTNELLENVGGQEAYSFTDGFSGYHQIEIVTEWGCFQYTVMPFGLKNALVIISHVVVAAFKEFIHKFLEVYFDDWNVFGLVKCHVVSLRLMLDTCQRYQITLNVKKCMFCVPFGNLFGHVVCR